MNPSSNGYVPPRPVPPRPLLFLITVDSMPSDNSLGSGVYYNMDDYAGVMRRLAVQLIDTLVLMAISISLAVIVFAISWSVSPTYNPILLFCLLWAASLRLYLVPLKRSRFRTVAYRLLGLMIVTTRGERPSLWIMTCRLLMWMFGPFNFLLDLIWLGADTESQSLRDCYLGTYVVRNGATPIGYGPMHLTRYNGAGLTLAYPRVCRSKSRDVGEIL